MDEITNSSLYQTYEHDEVQQQYKKTRNKASEVRRRSRRPFGADAKASAAPPAALPGGRGALGRGDRGTRLRAGGSSRSRARFQHSRKRQLRPVEAPQPLVKWPQVPAAPAKFSLRRYLPPRRSSGGGAAETPARRPRGTPSDTSARGGGTDVAAKAAAEPLPPARPSLTPPGAAAGSTKA